MQSKYIHSFLTLYVSSVYIFLYVLNQFLWLSSQLQSSGQLCSNLCICFLLPLLSPELVYSANLQINLSSDIIAALLVSV